MLSPNLYVRKKEAYWIKLSAKWLLTLKNPILWVKDDYRDMKAMKSYGIIYFCNKVCKHVLFLACG